MRLAYLFRRKMVGCCNFTLVPDAAFTCQILNNCRVYRLTKTNKTSDMNCAFPPMPLAVRQPKRFAGAFCASLDGEGSAQAELVVGLDCNRDRGYVLFMF